MLPSSSPVKETTVADVQLNDDGAPSQVNGYRVLKQLGEGTTSKVYHCQDESGQDFALKILNKSFLKRKREYKKVDGKMVFSNAFQKVQKEVAIMKKLSHENLVKLYEIIDSPADDKMVLVLELITGGQVMKWEEKGFRYRCPRTESGVLEHDDVRHCMRDVIDALDYLHKNSICHRDIKPENILLGADTTYKLADFGVAHMIEDSADKKTLRNTEGTYHFLAPECTTGNEYDPYMVDVWALGVTMFTLLYGTLPFGTKAASLSDVMDSIRIDPLVIDSAAIDADCEHLLRALMTKDPAERITIEALKRHPWLHQGAVPAVLPDRTEPSRVEVSREEIEAAFTPVNNFILMVRIKMKMAGRLARARNSLDLAKSQSAVSGDKPLRRTESTGPMTTMSDESMTSVESVADDTKSADHTSDATSTSTPGSAHTSPSTSPAKAALDILTRRLSFKSDAMAPIELSCDAVSPSTSPLREGLTSVLSRRKSSLNNNKPLIVEPSADLAVAAVAPSPSTSDLDRAKEGASEGSAKARRPAPLLLALPKLELTSGSHSNPSSPHALHHQLTPRMPREDSAKGWSEPDESTSIQRKSPTTKPRRSPKLHQGVVHPAALPDDESEDSSEIITSNSSPPKRKTQDEAKIAIANIVHRSSIDTTPSPTTSPVKEPSLMLQRRTSSTLYPLDTADVSSNQALPRLADIGRPLRHCASDRLAPVTAPPAKALTKSRSQRFITDRVNDRASTYATEHGDDGDGSDHTDDSGTGDSAASPRKASSPPRVLGFFPKTSGNNVAPLEGQADVDGEASRTRSRTDPSPSPVRPVRAFLPAVDTIADRSTDWIEPGSPPRRALFPRKTVRQSHETIRRLVLQRSESVKVLLTVKKPETDAAVVDRHTSLATLAGQPVHNALGTALSPRGGSIKSPSCVLQ